MRKVTITECWNQTPVIVRLTSQRSATWQSDGKLVVKEAGLTALFHQSTQCHTVVRWKALEKRRGLELDSTSQHSVTRWSDGKPVMKEVGLRALIHQSTQCHTVVRWKACDERGGA